MDFPDLAPVTPAATAPAPAPSVPPSPRPSVSLIPAAEWKRHAAENRGTDAYFAALPDGTPLRLTPAAVQFFEQLTGHLLWPEDVREAAILLWAASLTPAEQRHLWKAQPPLDAAAGAAPVIPAAVPEELHARFLDWQAARIPGSATVLFQVQAMAMALWNHENETALELDEAGMPEPEGEKKTPPAAVPIGSPPPSTPSPEETSPAGQTFSLPPLTAPSSPPTAPGSPPAATPSSPPPPVSAAARASDGFFNPSEGQPFWVPENVTRAGTYWSLANRWTKDIRGAVRFPTEAECRVWMYRHHLGPGECLPTEHLFSDAPR